MTTSTEESPKNNGDKNPKTATVNNTLPNLITSHVPQEIMDIMEYLSMNTNIFFKSQQRNEPELQKIEKLKVALDVYQRNPQTFLLRFGKYLQEKHLLDFARLSIADSDEEMHLMVKDYQNKLQTRQRDVKNRRYAALQQLIKEGEYFSEQEMMKRQPELYLELIGQHLSSKEKKQRDSYDVRNTTFSGILMHNLEQKQLNEIMEKAEQQVNSSHVNDTPLMLSSVDSINSRAIDNSEKEYVEVPSNCRQQWGNFDNEHIACTSSNVLNKTLYNKKDNPVSFEELITFDERELLRQEFISQMHQQFLTGQDDDFDYSTIDENTQYDDLNLINQDKEDKYFEESDEEGNDQNASRIPNNMEEDEESEDDLDVYMCHLNKHHSLQK